MYDARGKGRVFPVQGTSFGSPVLAGMLKYTGYGFFVLPNPEEINISEDDESVSKAIRDLDRLYLLILHL